MRVLVLGAGVSGLAAARLARDSRHPVAIYTEDDGLSATSEGFSVASGVWDPVLLTGIDLVVTSPGFPERSAPIVEALEWGVPVWGELEFAASMISVPLVAVTGTNGKTSVVEAVTLMLEESDMKVASVGNIGRPLSNYVDKGHDALVVEASSFQLRFVEGFHPAVAVITNVSSDHLDWHHSLENYRSAKARIFENQTERDLLIFDVEDPGACSLASGARSRLFPVSGLQLPTGGGGPSESRLVVGEMEVPLESLYSEDPTHIVNMAAASAAALEMGATPEAVSNAVTSFRPGRHRRQYVDTIAGVRYVNDSKATNPHAAIASIRSTQNVVLIAGGLDKGIDASELAAEPNVKWLLGIGDAGRYLVAAAGPKGIYVGDLENALRKSTELTSPGDTVLLAPGCASFDQFLSYSERGDKFIEIVNAMNRERAPL